MHEIKSAPEQYKEEPSFDRLSVHGVHTASDVELHTKPPVPLTPVPAGHVIAQAADGIA